MTGKGRSVLWSFNYAISGVLYTLRTQRNMRIHVGAALVTLIAALAVGISGLGLAAVIFAISLVFVTELVNTAIEAAIDLSTEGYDPIAKVAKDVAAGAVLVAATNAVVVAYLVMFGPIERFVEGGLRLTQEAPVSLTVVSLAVTLLLVIALKALAKEKSFLHGGWPSGHAALAFGAAVAVGYMTGNAGALVVGLFIAALVGQSRVEGEIHSVPQVLLGALLGTLIVTAAYQVFFRQ